MGSPKGSRRVNIAGLPMTSHERSHGGNCHGILIESRGNCRGVPQDPTGSPVRSPMRSPLACHGNPRGFPWETMGFPRYPVGSSVLAVHIYVLGVSDPYVRDTRVTQVHSKLLQFPGFYALKSLLEKVLVRRAKKRCFVCRRKQGRKKTSTTAQRGDQERKGHTYCSCSTPMS